MRWNSKICKYGDIYDIFFMCILFFFLFEIKSTNGDNFIGFKIYEPDTFYEYMYL